MTTIIIKFQLEGFHNFPRAKELFPAVSFLSDRHRHIFFFECEKEVFHDDRDVEFIMFKREVQSYLIEKYGTLNNDDVPSFLYPLEFGSMSCEMIARELLDKFDLITCSVFEDNENGSKIYKT